MNRKGNYSYDTLPRDEDGYIHPHPVPARRSLCKAATCAVMFGFAIFFSLLAISRFVTMKRLYGGYILIPVQGGNFAILQMRRPQWLLLQTQHLSLDGTVLSLLQRAF
jgi:hypothetical protein